MFLFPALPSIYPCLTLSSLLSSLPSLFHVSLSHSLPGSLFPSVWLSLSLFLSLSISRYIYLSLSLPAFSMCLCPSLYLSHSLCMYPSLSLSHSLCLSVSVHQVSPMSVFPCRSLWLSLYALHWSRWLTEWPRQRPTSIDCIHVDQDQTIALPKFTIAVAIKFDIYLLKKAKKPNMA